MFFLYILSAIHIHVNSSNGYLLYYSITAIQSGVCYSYNLYVVYMHWFMPNKQLS